MKSHTFSVNLVKVFTDIADSREFADVTLVSDDQIQTQAHKVVLSACSPVLKTLLISNPHSHPLLYLRGIKQTELQAVLNFMYHGETRLVEDRMETFLQVANDLGVKDLLSNIPSIRTSQTKLKPEKPEFDNPRPEDEVVFKPSNNHKRNSKPLVGLGGSLSHDVRKKGYENTTVPFLITCHDCNFSTASKSALSKHSAVKHRKNKPVQQKPRAKVILEREVQGTDEEVELDLMDQDLEEDELEEQQMIEEDVESLEKEEKKEDENDVTKTVGRRKSVSRSQTEVHYSCVQCKFRTEQSDRLKQHILSQHKLD